MLAKLVVVVSGLLASLTNKYDGTMTMLIAFGRLRSLLLPKLFVSVAE